jgi:transposase-like protein
LSILIQEYYHRRRDDHDVNSNAAYYAHDKGPPKKKKKVDSSPSTPKPKCNICGHQNHAMKDCHFKGKPKCDTCGRFSHKTKKCWGRKKPNIKKEHANIVHDPQEDEPVASMSYIAESDNNNHFEIYLWIRDSATTSHITHIKSAFIDYTPMQPIPIKRLGKTHVQAYGHGTIEVLTSTSQDV